MNLKPDTFWNLTPVQLFELLEGYYDRLEVTRNLIAWHMANTMNVHLNKKDKVTVSQLLGKFRKMTTIEMEENLDEAIKFFEEKRQEGGGHIIGYQEDSETPY